jgi:hypothetical protein
MVYSHGLDNAGPQIPEESRLQMQKCAKRRTNGCTLVLSPWYLVSLGFCSYKTAMVAAEARLGHPQDVAISAV